MPRQACVQFAKSRGNVGSTERSQKKRANTSEIPAVDGTHRRGPFSGGGRECGRPAHCKRFVHFVKEMAPAGGDRSHADGEGAGDCRGIFSVTLRMTVTCGGGIDRRHRFRFFLGSAPTVIPTQDFRGFRIGQMQSAVSGAEDSFIGLSSRSVGASGIQPSTLWPVFGHLQRNGAMSCYNANSASDTWLAARALLRADPYAALPDCVIRRKAASDSDESPTLRRRRRVPYERCSGKPLSAPRS